MSIKPSKNPVPAKIWKEIKFVLAAHGVVVREEQRAIVDDVGDEYATFAILYVKEP